jgi:uracil phosphoribosyltransferase
MLTVVDHPLAKFHLTALRDQTLPTDAFRGHLLRLTRVMAYPVFKGLELEPLTVTTPLLKEAVGSRIQRMPVLVPILRAGLGMVEGFLDLVPGAAVSHLGIYRDHATLEPVDYYSNFPKSRTDDPVFVLDPMLATGGSAVHALHYLKRQGAHRLTLVCVIAAPKGVEQVFLEHPEVPIFTAAVDDALSPKGYILPGLGDAGDRQFGTLT